MSVVIGEDGRGRCSWGAADPEYRRYHDEEWGTPLHGDRPLFEKLSLEGFQAGLSWITILRRRPVFREVFHDFDIATVAAFTETDVDALVWGFAPPTPRPRPRAWADIPAVTPESEALSKALRKLGFRFVGPTTAYAAMQACGMVDDHLAGCPVVLARTGD